LAFPLGFSSLSRWSDSAAFLWPFFKRIQALALMKYVLSAHLLIVIDLGMALDYTDREPVLCALCMSLALQLSGLPLFFGYAERQFHFEAAHA
jgi:hypothetical protein